MTRPVGEQTDIYMHEVRMYARYPVCEESVYSANNSVDANEA